MQCGPETESPDVSGLKGLAGENEIVVEREVDNLDSGSSSSIDPPRSTLIEFPGVIRRSEPPWRKELSRRVREVQERRAREGAEAPVAIRTPVSASADPVLAQLELVPELPTPAMNQIVENALRRVERARKIEPLPPMRTPSPAHAPVQQRSALAVTATTEERSLAPKELEDATAPGPVQTEVPEKKKRSLKRPKLVAVAASASAVAASPSEVAASLTKEEKPIAKPLPLTLDIERVAVSYLESHFPELAIDQRSNRAGFGIRVLSACFDLLFIALLSAPFAAGIEFADGNWNDPRIQGLMIGTGLMVMILYLTLLTAFSGRTWGMRLFSIRAIDVRTGLLPSGGQSIVRAFSCLLSIATLGFGLAYALIDPDKRTLPDRFSKTIVVRD